MGGTCELSKYPFPFFKYLFCWLCNPGFTLHLCGMAFRAKNRFFWVGILLLAGVFFFCPGCKSPSAEQLARRGFYFWKTRYHPDSTELAALHDLQVKQLYVRFFDVALSADKQQAAPVGMLRAAVPFPENIAITPVVFITTEVLLAPNFDPDVLAGKMADLLQKLGGKYPYTSSEIIQIDCDWTTETREAYFTLLEALKKQTVFEDKKLSVTIRLHQIKFAAVAGIPPADRGLLMCYNMGNLRDPAANNSIIDPETFSKYIQRASDYPLPLDAALPLFDWWVWFKNKKYYGLIHAGNLPETMAGGKTTRFKADTSINGYAFEKGDRIRHENSPIKSLEAIINRMPEKMRSVKNSLLLFHLDSASLSKYTTHELENLYRSFH